MSAGEFLLNLGNFPWLVFFGVFVGALGGFFGVGGGFLMVPLLNAVFGIPYNIAVGSDLGQMCGMSTAATIRHSRFGNIDFKLGVLMIAGTAAGVEAGARILEALKHAGTITIAGKQLQLMSGVMGLVYAILLIFLGQAMIRESLGTLRRTRGKVELSVGVPGTPAALRLRTMKLWPMVSLPSSGIEAISLWVILVVGFLTGFLSGMLGVGGGFIRMPALVYILGCPTVVAVGTDLFEIMFSSAYGVLTHSFKGNVHLVLVLALLMGTAVGGQIGASYTRKAGGPWVRFGLGCFIFVAVVMVLAELWLRIAHG